MTCPREHEAVSYLYGEGPEVFESHLAQCAECAEFVRDSRQVRELYRAVSREDVMVSKPVSSRPRWRWMAGMGLSAAAALAVAWIVTLDVKPNVPTTPVKNVAPAVEWENVDQQITRLSQDSIRALVHSETTDIIDEQIAELRSRMRLLDDERSF